jgi:hypothetical protein
LTIELDETTVVVNLIIYQLPINHGTYIYVNICSLRRTVIRCSNCNNIDLDWKRIQIPKEIDKVVSSKRLRSKQKGGHVAERNIDTNIDSCLHNAVGLTVKQLIGD